MGKGASTEQVVREIHRRTRRRFSAEEKVRIVLEGLRGEESVAELCLATARPVVYWAAGAPASAVRPSASLSLPNAGRGDPRHLISRLPFHLVNVPAIVSVSRRACHHRAGPSTAQGDSHMLRRYAVPATLLVVTTLQGLAQALDSGTLSAEAGCQRRIASQGARFAQRVVKASLKCATEISDCQIQCEEERDRDARRSGSAGTPPLPASCRSRRGDDGRLLTVEPNVSLSGARDRTRPASPPCRRHQSLCRQAR
jgi:hypothetical protein